MNENQMVWLEERKEQFPLHFNGKVWDVGGNCKHLFNEDQYNSDEFDLVVFVGELSGDKELNILQKMLSVTKSNGLLLFYISNTNLSFEDIVSCIDINLFSNHFIRIIDNDLRLYGIVA